MRKFFVSVFIMIFILTGGFFIGESQNAFAAKKPADISSLGAEVSPYKKYTMYLGTKDKDTHQQELPTETIKEQMHEICVKYVDGYTLSVMDGYYRDNDSNMIHEVSLVYVFLDTPIDALQKIMDEALVKFNQSSILLEENETKGIFYSRK